MKKQVRWIIEGMSRQEFILPEPCTGFTVGNRANSDILIPACPADGFVQFCKGREEVTISCSQGLSIIHGGTKTSSLSVNEDVVISVVDIHDTLCFRTWVCFIEYGKTPTFDRSIELASNRIRFGSSADCQVCFPMVNDQTVAFEINQGTQGITISAQAPLFGVYVNSKRLAPSETKKLYNGDFIFAENSQFVLMNGFIIGSSNTDVMGLPYTDSFEQNSHLEYPRMNRTSRYHEVPPTDSIEILDPPSLPEKESRNIFLSILPTIVMAVLIVFVRGSFSSTGGMMLFSVLSMAVGAAGSVLTYFESSKTYQKKQAKREESYKRYIRARRNEIKALRNKERQIMKQLYISPRKEIENVEEFSADLFDRTQSDQDFLDIRLGYGLIPSGQPIKCKRHEVFEQTDDLFKIPSMVAAEFAFNDDLPAVVHAQKANAIGFQGTFSSLGHILNQTVLDLVTRQHPQDLHLYFFCGPEFESQVNSYRLLPHVWDSSVQRRNIAYDMESRDQLLEKVYKAFSLRDANRQGLGNIPWMVVFVYADDEIMHHPIMKYIDHASELHVVFVFLAQYREQLPLGCKYTIKLFSNENGGQLIDMYNKEDDRVFRYDCIGTDQMDALARRLAPIYSGEMNLSAMLVQSLSFFEMLKTPVINKNEIKKNWQSADPRISLAAPLGVVAGGETISLDIHEKIHGPHGLVAGTTGSGKSELLISYVLSMAYHYSPEDVTFVIIDFKGSGLAGPLAGLPHLIGTITNLDKREIDRSLMSIRAESLRRQRLFAESGEDENTIKNINEYMTAYRQGKVKTPLPHLVIIVDEFAELKAQHPEFMDELISTSRIGRSLGIHLILATQKPSGVVNEQIWSNSDFKLCLRVQTQEDSNEVLKSPLAAEIREPGRAYLQVGRSETFTLFQSGYSGASAEAHGEQGTPFQLVKLSMAGEPSILFERKAEKNEKDDLTQLSVIKEAIKSAFAESDYEEPSMLCLPPLSEIEDFPEKKSIEKYKLPIGVFDHPALQMQGTAVCDLLDGNLLIVGASQSGKTNLMQTILRGAAESLTADEINIYVMDFNTGVFKTMESLSVIGGVILMEQRERVKNLIKLLTLDIESRKEKMIDASVTSFRAYQNTGRSDLPAILVMIDNFAVFNDLYGEEFEDDLITLLREGQSVGIVFCVSVAQPNLIGMRRLCYFDQRIALHMQDHGEVSMFMDGCRKYAPEIPGRAVWKLDKEYLDMQVFLAFRGVTEQERIDASIKFLKQHADAPYARIIPEVPLVLTHESLEKMFMPSNEEQMFIYGMSYENVEPVSIDIYRQFELALVGKNIQGKNRFLELLIQHLTSVPDVRIHIVDHYDRPLKSYAEKKGVCEYTLDVDRIIEMVDTEYTELTKRLEDVRENGSDSLTKYPLDVFIINTRDAIIRLSESGGTMDRYTELQNRCKQMKALFVFSDIENRYVNYNSPTLIRNMTESPQALLFEGLSNGRMYEFDAFLIRENRYPLGRDDAFRIDDATVDRIKLIWD